MATIIIDGRRFTGNSVSIVNGRVIIDGKPQDGALNGVVEIKITEGVLGHLTCDAAISCGKVEGNVTAGGSVSCDDVAGSVQAGGSVSCGKIGGSVLAGGSVRHE